MLAAGKMAVWELTAIFAGQNTLVPHKINRGNSARAAGEQCLCPAERSCQGLKRDLIIVSSVTYAMKGKELLQKRGFQAYITRLPQREEGAGCGYCIYVNGNTDLAEQILRTAGIRVLGRSVSEVE